MRRCSLFLVLALLFVPMHRPLSAHFQLLRPDDDIVTRDDPRVLRLDAIFTHPMEQVPVMEMGQPRQFGVLYASEKHSLLKQLKPRKINGKTAYGCSFKIPRPADYVFYIEPAPYWEPGEGKMIIHYTKVIVDAFGAEKGWDDMVGFPVEIEPLVRPYGLWTGNIFRGIVHQDGEPVPFAEIEVEYWNAGKNVDIPSSPFVTQVIRADADGEFSYAMPRAGWWGFAALVEGDQKLKNPDGKEVPVELGGLIWVRTVDMD